jgi:hypothetical protein
MNNQRASATIRRLRQTGEALDFGIDFLAAHDYGRPRRIGAAAGKSRTEWRALKDRLLPYTAEVNKIAVSNVTSAELGHLWGLLERINRSLYVDHQHFAEEPLRGRRTRVKRSTRLSK